MIRQYDPTADADALWELKRAFERELGANTGGDDKAAKYEGKLDDEYRRRYLEWVEDCVGKDERCVHVADADDDDLAGYVFVLPDALSMIWDAAVLNEIYVRERYRGTGVADDLVQAAVDTAERQDLPLDRLVLDVDPDNARALGLYDRFGFEHWGEMRSRPLGE